jgi:hypothetical protein
MASAFQIIFYLAALTTWLAPPFRSFKVLNVAYFFASRTPLLSQPFSNSLLAAPEAFGQK